MTRLPRLLVAAPASGHGKTTVTTGLMAALRADGDVVSPHKVGPDYIDPGFHALACGRPGRNLDPWLCGEDLVAPLLLHGASVPTPATIAVIEGVMGLFDGRLGTDGYASSAHVARLTGSPVLLVVDASHASRSVGALVHGLASYDPSIRVGGVILNKVGSPAHEAEIRRAIEPLEIPVLGSLARDADIEHPSRHLGLVPAEESAESERLVAALARRVAESVDLDAVRALAATAPDLDAEPWDPRSALGDLGAADGAPGHAPTVAVFGGRAFTFRYRETVELLQAAGARVVEVDPLTDAALPDGTAGLYLGGGFPEVHATELAANASFAASVRAAVAAGVPTVAECAGLLYLGRCVDDVAMSAALPHTAAMHPRLAMGYRTATAPADTLLARAGEAVTGHEFHRTRVDAPGVAPAWTWGETRDGVSADPCGGGAPTVHASYLHVHWAGHPQLARRFVAAVRRHAAAPDLDHHGDADLVPGALNLAVNVHPDGPPAWLADAIRGADVTAYPDASPARVAIAAHHGLAPETVLPTAGAAEAFTLLAQLWRDRRWVVVHPQFTEPESALRTAGARVARHVLAPPFRLEVDALLATTTPGDVVLVGNPTNPTSVLHDPADLGRLTDAGLTLVVDEAFLDADEGHSMLGHEGVVVVRSLTKLWGIPGVRAGWVSADPATIAGLARRQPPWALSAQAIAAILAVCSPRGDDEARRRVDAVPAARADLVARLGALGLAVVPDPAAPFVLVDTGLPTSPRAALAARGVAVRRGETFPGLGPSWLRLAVRTPAAHRVLCDALAPLLEGTR